MPITIRTSVMKTTRTDRSINMTVESDDSSITVKAGTFKAGGAGPYELLSDEVWTYTPVANDTSFVAYLALDESDASVVLLVDDFEAGELPFEFEGSGYTRLHQIWMTVVEGGQPDLSNCTLHVYHVEQNRGDRDARQDQ